MARFPKATTSKPKSLRIMEKVIVAVVTAILCSIFGSKAQESDLKCGAKGEAHSSTSWDRVEMHSRPGINYQYKTTQMG